MRVLDDALVLGTGAVGLVMVLLLILWSPFHCSVFVRIAESHRLVNVC